MDGNHSSISVIIYSENYASAFTIDYVGGTLYWSDRNQGIGNITSSYLDGSNHRTVIEMSDFNYIEGMTVSDNALYWTDAGGQASGSVHACNKYTGGDSTLFATGLRGIRMIKVFTKDIQITGMCFLNLRLIYPII